MKKAYKEEDTGCGLEHGVCKESVVMQVARGLQLAQQGNPSGWMVINQLGMRRVSRVGGITIVDDIDRTCAIGSEGGDQDPQMIELFNQVSTHALAQHLDNDLGGGGVAYLQVDNPQDPVMKHIMSLGMQSGLRRRESSSYMPPALMHPVHFNPVEVPQKGYVVVAIGNTGVYFEIDGSMTIHFTPDGLSVHPGKRFRDAIRVGDETDKVALSMRDYVEARVSYLIARNKDLFPAALVHLITDPRYAQVLRRLGIPKLPIVSCETNKEMARYWGKLFNKDGLRQVLTMAQVDLGVECTFNLPRIVDDPTVLAQFYDAVERCGEHKMSEE